MRREGRAAAAEFCSCSETGRGGLQLQNSSAAVRQEGGAAAADFCSRSEGKDEGCCDAPPFGVPFSPSAWVGESSEARRSSDASEIDSKKASGSLLDAIFTGELWAAV